MPSSSVHVFAMFLPSEAVKLRVVDPATQRQPIPRFESTYTELYLKKRKELHKLSIFSYPEKIRPTIDYNSNEAIALKALSRELGLLEIKPLTLVL